MKFFKYIFFILLFIPLISNAQLLDIEDESEEDNTILGFGCPLGEFANINKTAAFSMGIEGYVYMNRFFIGAYGLGLTSDMKVSGQIDSAYFNDMKLALHHGGLWVGYNLSKLKRFRINVGFRFGWGTIGLIDNIHGANFDKKAKNSIYVLSPMVDFEYIITRNVKTKISVGYREIKNIEHSVYDGMQFNNPSLSLSLMFGNFLKD